MSKENAVLMSMLKCVFLCCFVFQDHGVAFMETSAKTGMNVELAFMAIAR